MDFDQLATFVEVAKLGNFSRAGQKVFRSQSAVSAQVRQLEEEYGERLFDRAAKSVRLTPAGEALFEYAERMLAMRTESLRAVADQGATPRGVLAIGANEATCLYVLPTVFEEYHKLYPAVRITIYRNFSVKVLQKVEEGAVDVGIVTLPIKAPALHIYPFYRDRLMVMTAPSSPLASKRSITLAELAEQPLIFPKTGFTRHVLDKLFRPYGSRLRVTMELPSVGMIKKFVAAGLGVTLISAGFAAKEAREGTVKLMDVEGAELTRELGVIYRKDRTLPRSASAFLELIKQRAAVSKKAAKSAATAD